MICLMSSLSCNLMGTLSPRTDGLWRRYDRHYRCETSSPNMKLKCEQHQQQRRMAIGELRYIDTA
jgi:hypothetical protein